jgi:hypothetical protein
LKFAPSALTGAGGGTILLAGAGDDLQLGNRGQALLIGGAGRELSAGGPSLSISHRIGTAHAQEIDQWFAGLSSDPLRLDWSNAAGPGRYTSHGSV